MGLVVAASNPIAGLAVAGAATKLATRGIKETHRAVRDDGDQDEFSSDSVGETEELRAYGESFPQARQNLARLENALTQIAASIAEDGWKNLSRLQVLVRRQRLIAAQIAPLRTHFTNWVLMQTTREVADHREVQIEIGDLPTAQALKTTIAAGPSDGYTGELDWWERPNADLPPWMRWARDAGLAISLDYDEPPQTAANQEPGDPDDIVVWFRPGRAATVTTWAITKQLPAEVRDGGGEPTTSPAKFDARRTEVRHLRVVSAQAKQRRLDLETGAFKSGKLRVVFNTHGEPSEFGGDSSALVASTVSSAPTQFKDSLGQGSALATALVPGSAAAARVKQALEVAKNRKELDPLINPPVPDAETKAAKELENEVAIAELEARLELARRLARDPQGALIVQTLANGPEA